jgi:protein tyrosine phosphatase (PTP) superfamily phosphohydrolase (DUF442 family)
MAPNPLVTLEIPNPELSARSRRRRRIVIAVITAGLLALVAVPVGPILFADNFRTLLPGRVYRSAQMSEASLERAVQKHGIRTVINLRGIGLGMDWYHDECRAAHRCNVAMEDIGLSAGRLPPSSEIRYLVRVLDESEYPLVIHCKQGSDRTGLVAALILLLKTDADVPTARAQLSIRYGHVAIGRTVYMGRFFDLYETWLMANHRQHSREVFRSWLEHEYTAGPASARLEWLQPPGTVASGQPSAVRVRAWNTSTETWHLEPGNTAGVHCAFMLTDSKGECWEKGRAGLFRAEVQPGESIDLVVPLPAIPQCGSYQLLVDMMDEAQQSYFYQHGSKPLVSELMVAEKGTDATRSRNATEGVSDRMSLRSP